MDASDPFDLCGVTIDNKYRVASVVGDGGFGVVYRGVHKGFGETIAVKCLKLPGELDEAGKAEFLEKLQDEGRLLHRLSKATSGIVQALDVGAMTTVDGKWVPYLVLEWLEGETLAENLKTRLEQGNGGMSVDRAMGLLDPVARALASAHSQKVAHRDVKPANIFLADVAGKRTAKVLDFGIAKVLSDHRGYTTALESTAQTPAAFTPRYGAPEQFNKQRGATGPWTDVFALALVFVECVTGRKGLEGDDPTQLYIASADRDFRPTLGARGVDTAPEIDAVLRRALEVEPKLRYGDVGSFWNDLRAAAGIEGGDPLPSGGLRNSAPPGDQPVLALTEPSEGSRAARQVARGATLPAESMRKSPARKATSSRPSGSDDPMAETPRERRGASNHTQDKRGPSGVSIILSILALAVFAAGGLFAYATFVQSTNLPKPPSATNSAKQPPRDKPTAKPVPSSPLSAQSTASAAPSVSTSAAAPPGVPDDMVMIAGATFKLAGGEDATLEGFYLDRDEVKASQYQACINAKNCTSANGTAGLDEGDRLIWDPKCNLGRGATDHAANCVTAAQAEAFCTALGRRLPSSEEWELAARGPRQRRYPWGGGAPTCDLACWGRNSTCAPANREVTTCAVGSFPEDRTEDGVRGLSGNVSEWTSSGGANRIVRGGNFFEDSDALLATHRITKAVTSAHPTVGFRCAMSLPPPSP